MIEDLKPKRVIALISDGHTGSKYALWPDGFKDEAGGIYKLSAGQKQILEHWHKFIKVCDSLDVDTVLHLGDAIHGTNRKGFGKFLITSDLEVQKDAAEELLKPLVKDRLFIPIIGSCYHQSLDTEIHKDLAGRFKNGVFGGAVCNIKLKGTDRRINMVHGASGAVVYRTTVMSREGIQMLEAESLGKLKKFHIIARGHWHWWGHLHLTKQHLIQIPCWMAWEPSKIYTKSYGKMQPDIGGVIVLIDQKDRIKVWPYIYPTPHIADAIKYL